MRTVFITEGEGEYAALPLLKHQIQERTGIHLIPPMRITIQPDGPATKIGRSIKQKLLPTLMAKQVEKAVVLLDREMRGDCPGEIAIEVLAAVRSLCGTGIDFTVVLKDRCFENWLVADVQSLKAQPGRFRVSNAAERKISPNKADSIDAQRLLSSIVIGRDFQKVEDAKNCLKNASLDRMAQNSRSVRHFLHVLGDPTYSDGCRNP